MGRFTRQEGGSMICHLSFRDMGQDFPSDRIIPTYINLMAELNQTRQRALG